MPARVLRYCWKVKRMKREKDQDIMHEDLSKKNSLAAKKSVLLLEWDYERNTSLDPRNVSAQSHKKAFWTCDKSHSWEAAIRDRTNGYGCPYCSGHRLLIGFNDFETVCHENVKLWDYSKNGTALPRDFYYNSKQRVFWKCDKGHQWEAAIKDVSKSGQCPYCIGKKVWKGFNDFEAMCSDKVKLWDYEKNGDLHPDELFYHSGIRAWWKCGEGHNWQATIRNIAEGGKCPYCSGIKVIQGKTDLLTLHPDVCEKWDYELNPKQPSEFFSKSKEIVHWRCKNGHRWTSRIYSVVNNNTQCPVCSRRRLQKGVNDLATLGDKELLEEWDYELNDISPDQITAHNGKKECCWICRKCGGRWKATVHKRFDRRYGCPFCSGKKVITGKTDLATLCPEIVEWWSEDNSKRPEECAKYSSFNAIWKCPNCKETFKREVRKHVSIMRCPFCVGSRVVVGKNDLATKQPFLVKEWDYKNNKYPPEHYSEYSNKKVWWVCSACGHEWRAMINNRSSKGRGCPKCSKGH